MPVAAASKTTRRSATALRAGATAKQLREVPPDAVETVGPPLNEIGVDGIGNYGGTLTAETNPELFHTAAYGRAGSREWGQWELRRRTDEAVSKAIDFVLSPIRDATVSIKPAGERPEQVAQAEYIRWNFTEALEPGWGEVLNQTVGGSLSSGFAVHEKCFEVCEHELLPNGRGYKVSKLAERLPSSLLSNAWIENEKTGELTGIRQQGPRAGKWQSLVLPASKILLNTWNRNGNNYAGYSAFRAVWYACKVREHLLKMTAVTLVREGAGIPVAFTTDPKAKLSKSQRDSLIKLLQNLVYHENAALVMPTGWEMAWIYSPGANKGHVVDTYNALGLLILEQVGAQQLYLGTSGTGARAVGQVHQAQSEMFIRGAIRNVEDLFNGVGKRRYTGLIRDLVDFNWGPPKDGKYPKLELGLQPQQLQPGELGDALTKAKAAGVFTATIDDENAFRNRIGFKPIDEETRDAEKEKARALLPPPQAPFGGGTPSNEEKKPDPFAKASLRAAAAPFVPRRALRPSEKCLNLTAMAATFDQAPEDFADGVKPLVAEMLMKALPQLKLAMADGDASDVGNIKLDTKRLDTFVGVYLESLRAEGYRQVHAEMKRQLSSVPVAMRGASEEDDKYETQASEDAQQTLDTSRKHLVKRMAQRLSSDLEKHAIDIERTESEPEEAVIRTLGQQVSSNAYKQDAAIVTTKAFNVGRQEFADERGDQIESVELSEAMDINTCAPCEDLDGKEMEFGSDEEVSFTPPHSSICDGGDRCRGVKVFNFKKSGDGDDPESDE